MYFYMKASDYQDNPLKLSLIVFFCIFGVVLLLIAIFGSFYIVGAGERAVIVTLGKASDVAEEPGMHFKMPLVQKAVKFDVKTQKYETEASAASSDLQTVQAQLAINYHVEPSSVPRIYKEIGLDYHQRVIQPAIQEAVKATTAQYSAEELVTRRPEVKDQMVITLRERLIARDIVIEDVSITNFAFSESFDAAIEAKVTAEQLRLKAENDLERIKVEAEQRIAQATGEAEAIRIQANAITAQGGAEYVQLQAISKWDGVLPQFTGGGAIPFINIPIGGSTA